MIGASVLLVAEWWIDLLTPKLFTVDREYCCFFVYQSSCLQNF